MGFYLKKSIKVGAFRFNFSKSGVGVSTGFRGLRIGTGPRGNYIHAGRNGFYYRTTLPPISEKAKKDAKHPIYDVPIFKPDEEFKEIDSGNVLDMIDSSAISLLKELNEKIKKTGYSSFITPLLIIIGFLLTTFALCSGFPLLLILIPIYALIALSIGYFALVADEENKTTVIFYDFEPEIEAKYQKLHDAFDRICSCGKIWHIHSQKNTSNYKMHSGATSLIDRIHITLSKGSPPLVKTNISVPIIPVGEQTLYFFPERILVFDKKHFGAVNYSDLLIEIDQTRFVEEQTLPRDAKVIDHAWKYQNKNGGPDKRYKDNYQIPIVLYQKVFFKSKSGLNELIQLSKLDQVENFKNAILELANQKVNQVTRQTQNQTPQQITPPRQSPPQQPQVIKNENKQTQFSEFVIGENEKVESQPIPKQTIPIKETSYKKPVSERVIEYPNYKIKVIPSDLYQYQYDYQYDWISFVDKAIEYQNQSESSAEFEPFMCYWPTYSNMNDKQLKFYFYWRTQTRKQNYINTDLSYIFVYAYELLNGIGYTSKDEGHQKLNLLWNTYRESHPKLDNYLPQWIMGYAIVNNFPIDPLEFCYDCFLKTGSVLYPDLLLDKFIGKNLESLPIEVFDYICNYQITKSKFYKEGHKDLVEEYIPKVVQKVNENLAKNTSKDILEYYKPKNNSKLQRHAFSSAIVIQDYIIEYPTLSLANYDLRNFMTPIVKHTENKLRERTNFNGRLRGYTIEPEYEKIINSILFDIPVTPEKTTITIDMFKVEHLTRESKEVQNILLSNTQIEQPEETPEVEQKRVIKASKIHRPEDTPGHLLTDLDPVYDILSMLKKEEMKYIRLLMDNNYQISIEDLKSSIQEIQIDVLTDKINELSMKFVGDILIVNEENMKLVTEDFRDELGYLFMLEKKAEISFICSDTSCTLPDNWIELKIKLDKINIETLKALLNKETVNEEIKKIAFDNLTMPQLLLDNINELALETVGDIIIDTSREIPFIEDEDIDYVNKIIF